MNYIIDLQNIKHKCRVCLTPINQMIALTCKLYEENVESPDLCDTLETLFSVKVNVDSSYSEGVCLPCYKKIKIAYALKTTLENTQYILDRYVKLLSLQSSVNSNTESYQNVEDVMNEDIKSTSECYVKENLDEEELRLTTMVKQELIEEQLPLTDYVILQVTSNDEDSNLEEDIEKENNQNIDKDMENDQVTAEFFDVNNYTIEKTTQPDILHYCPICEKALLTKIKLDQHFKVCQKYNLKRYDICKQQFSSQLKKLYHMKIKHGPNSVSLECDKCNEVFENHKARSYHMKTKHDFKKFACEICRKAFHFKSSLDTHMDTHTKDKFREICPECGKGFHYRGGLFYHMKMHRDERNYLCTYCNSRFLNMSGLTKHIRIHTGEKPCQCEYCGKRFRSSSILKKHEKTHTGHRPYSCPYCGKGFISTYNLQVHKAGHAGNYPCAFCDKSFLNVNVVKLHMRFKHNDKDYTGTTEDSQ